MNNKLIYVIKHRSYLTMFILGCLSSLGFEPFNLFFLTIISYVFSILLLNNVKKLNKAFFSGLFFGLGHHLVGLYWISVSFKVAESGGYFMGSIAVFFLCFFLSLFTGIAFFVVKKRCKNVFSTKSCITIILAFTLFDWIKGNILWGFPWLPISAIWSFHKVTLYPFSLLGVWGYSLITFSLISGMVLIRKNIYKAGILILPFFFSIFYPYINKSNVIISEDKIKIKLVQPNIAQNEKWKKEYIEKNLNKTIKLSQKTSNENVDLIIWPETAVAFDLESNSIYNNVLSKFVQKTNYLLLGAVRRKKNNDILEVYNSVFLLDSKKKIVGIHDKINLVPFGEFIPFRNLFSITKLTQGSSDFSRGKDLRILSIKNKNTNILPLICYEVIFPSTINNLEENYNLIVNVTNDGWYGNTSGPYQHFALSKIRAVQEGLTLIRVANNGISGIINFNGEVVSKLQYDTEGTIKKEISLYKINTLYKNFGDKLFYGLFFILFIVLIYFEKRLKGNK